MEFWLPVPEYEGLYEVSDHGRVRSVDRVVRRSNDTFSMRRGKVLSPKVNTRGRLQVGLSRDGNRSLRQVHRLVLEAFVGPQPTGHQACHYDDDPLNNVLSNLRWDTMSSNQRDSVRNLKHANSAKTQCPQGHKYDYFHYEDGRLRHRACKPCRNEAQRRFKSKERV